MRPPPIFVEPRVCRSHRPVNTIFSRRKGQQAALRPEGALLISPRSVHWCLLIDDTIEAREISLNVWNNSTRTRILVSVCTAHCLLPASVCPRATTIAAVQLYCWVLSAQSRADIVLFCGVEEHGFCASRRRWASCSFAGWPPSRGECQHAREGI